MAISFPFESKLIDGQYDRAITAEMERQFNKLCWTNGVFPSPADGLLVLAGTTDNTVTVNPGGAHIEGARFFEASQRTLSLPLPHSMLKRVDRVVLRFDSSEAKRNIDLYVKEGVASSVPEPPEVKTESNYYELVLADIYRIPGQSAIYNTYITDQRANPEVCGMVLPAIPYEAQSEQLWLQLKEGVRLVESALDETTAGNLQAQITSNDGDISALQSMASRLESDIEIDAQTLSVFQSLGYTGGGITQLFSIIARELAKKVTGLSTQSYLALNPTVGNTWTASSDCLVTINAAARSETEMVLYFDTRAALWSKNGAMTTATVPLRKGEKLKLTYVTNCQRITLYVRPLNY